MCFCLVFWPNLWFFSPYFTSPVQKVDPNQACSSHSGNTSFIEPAVCAFAEEEFTLCPPGEVKKDKCIKDKTKMYVYYQDLLNCTNVLVCFELNLQCWTLLSVRFTTKKKLLAFVQVTQQILPAQSGSNLYMICVSSYHETYLFYRWKEKKLYQFIRNVYFDLEMFLIPTV